MSRAAWAITLAGAAVALATGCGRSPGANQIPGKRLVIYMSMPLHGASNALARSQVNAARLALGSVGGRVGRYRIVVHVLDDSTPQGEGWDPSQTTVNARLAARDPATVGYIGELNSGATAISIPVLNRAGIAQVSPASGAVGLTTQGPGASPGEPGKYYPTGVRTFARVVPNDAVEAEAQAGLEARAGCHSIFVLHDAEVDGSSTAITFALTAAARGLNVLGVQAFSAGAPDYSGLAGSVAQAGADCVLIAALDGPSAARLARDVAVELPDARIFAASTLAQPSFVDSARGGLAPAVASRVLLVDPALGASAYPPAARSMLAAYRAQFGPAPPGTVFGYAAMSLMLDVIRRATDGGREPPRRSKLLRALLARGVHQSVLGPYRLNGDGDTSLSSYGIYRIARGHLEFVRAAAG